METKKTVIFDDGCPTCRVGMEFAQVHGADTDLKFVGMNTEEGRVLVAKHKLDMNASAYVLRGDGSRAEKARMMVDIFSRAGLLGFVMSLPFRIPYLSVWLYNLLALHRKHVTKTNR